MTSTKKYFSIHNMDELKDGDFSVIRGNIENTPEKVKLAKEIYHEDVWYFEFHDYTRDMNWVTN